MRQLTLTLLIRKRSKMNGNMQINGSILLRITRFTVMLLITRRLQELLQKKQNISRNQLFLQIDIVCAYSFVRKGSAPLMQLQGGLLASSNLNTCKKLESQLAETQRYAVLKYFSTINRYTHLWRFGTTQILALEFQLALN